MLEYMFSKIINKHSCGKQHCLCCWDILGIFMLDNAFYHMKIRMLFPN